MEVLRMVTDLNAQFSSQLRGQLAGEAENVALFSPAWWLSAAIASLLVCFAGIMSGLTLGLMSMSPVDLEVLQASGTPEQQRQAALIHPVVKAQHQLLVTLLLCNAGAMEALPLVLDRMANPIVAVILSVTLVLLFGEIIPQAICSRYGLAVGASCIWLVRFLMIACYPVAYPIGMILDTLLGHEDPLFRRNQLKALVSIHGMEAGRGGELTHDETTIIGGALDLTTKTAAEAMTPIESTFSLDVNAQLDWGQMSRILARGHSRVPVFQDDPKNIIGVLLVKSLLTLRPEDCTPVSNVSIRRIPRMPADWPLYNVLNEFQKGSSHMAAVVRKKPKILAQSIREISAGEAAQIEEAEKINVKKIIESENGILGSSFDFVRGQASDGNGTETETETEESHIETAYLLKPEGSVISTPESERTELKAEFLVKENEAALQGDSKYAEFSEIGREREVDMEQGISGIERIMNQNHNNDLERGSNRDGGERGWKVKSNKWIEPFGKGWRLESDLKEEEEVVGIITLEDVIEELLQEEIVDETDEYIDVHKKIKVAAALKKQISSKDIRGAQKQGIPTRHSSPGMDIPQPSQREDPDFNQPILGSSAP